LIPGGSLQHYDGDDDDDDDNEPNVRLKFWPSYKHNRQYLYNKKSVDSFQLAV
jgi:hypothetical protein